jgi:hypothetical protein
MKSLQCFPENVVLFLKLIPVTAIMRWLVTGDIVAVAHRLSSGSASHSFSIAILILSEEDSAELQRVIAFNLSRSLIDALI